MNSLSIDDFAEHIDGLISLLQDLVGKESPSTDKHALDALGSFVAERMQSLGARVERYPQNEQGDHWMGTWGSGPGGILLLVHLDTVYPMGTLATMPWRQDGTHVYGPGCLDMKVSLAMALTAIDRLIHTQNMRADRTSLLCSSDEEIGSLSSRALIESQAQEHAVVLCLEPALPDGSLKTWRKGILNFQLEAVGRAAHAGSDIKAGTNAIVEIAHQIPALLDLADDSADTTINPGVIQGGSRSNVVPDVCRLEVDVRAKTLAEGERVYQAIQNLEPALTGASLHIEGGWNRPPMERDPLMQATFQRAAEIAARLGLILTEGGTGGGSDANFVAGLGIPVLDGLGAIGKGAHSERERVEVGSLARRCALLAALISDW
ncbi:MAG: M20 family peptidase [Anaerolineales bacterium]|nr:MAG: M20 family peptidase [Anaerolineales bacterium]